MPSGTLTAATGVITLQRNAVTLRWNRALRATVSAYPPTGTPTPLTRVRTLSASSGALSLTAPASKLLWHRKLIATTRALALTGYAAILQKNARALQLNPTPAALALTPMPLVLRWNRVLIATVRTITLTGNPAVLIRPLIMSAVTRALGLVGSAAVLTWSRVYAILPTLPGLTYPVQKKHLANTVVHTTASGKEMRASWWRDPLFEWGLSYELLRTQIVNGTAYTEFENLAGFFNTVRGRASTFLFDDVTDDTATNSLFDTGDGVTRTFTLRRVLGGGAVPIGAVNTITNVSVAGVATSAYTIAGNQITFAVAPANCADLTWTGTFFYKVRFRDDIASFANFMQYLWENKAIWLRQVK